MTRQASLTVVTTPQHNKVLLVKRKDVPVWVLPGGGVDENETIEEAAKRELFEETGITSPFLQHVLSLTPINALSEPTHIFITFVPQEILAQHMFQDISDECDEIAIFSKDELPSMLFPIHRLWIHETLSIAEQGKKALPYTRKMDEVSYPWLIQTLILHPILSIRYLTSMILRFFS